MIPEAGLMDRRVTIQYVTDGEDSRGTPTEDWTTLDPVYVYMQKNDLQGRERLVAHQMSAPADTRWVMGYRSDMDPELVNVPKKRRLSYQGRIYDIVSAEMIGRREGIELVTLSRNA